MSGHPIHINPTHKGKLTEKVGKKGLTEKNLTKEIASAKKSGNVKLEKEEVFAKNAKSFNHHSTGYKGKDSREGRLHKVKTDRGEFRMKDNYKGE